MTSVRISQQGVLRERPSHATYLAQCCKTRSDGVGDLGPHGDVGVDVNTKIPGGSDWRHQSITDTNRISRHYEIVQAIDVCVNSVCACRSDDIARYDAR